MYLLDTNAIINYLNNSLTPGGMLSMSNIVDDHSNISVITKMEALGYNFKTNEDQNTTEEFINGSTLLDISNEVVNKTIVIRKSTKIDLPDAIIGATALVNNFILITSNLSDFKNIQGLKIVDPNNL